MSYALINLMYRLGKMTAAQVWQHVPADITEQQAAKICGPRPDNE